MLIDDMQALNGWLMRAAITLTTGSLRRWFRTLAISGTFMDLPGIAANMTLSVTAV